MISPAASSPEVRQRMLNVHRRDTRPEKAFRRAAHELGLRYLVDVPPIAGVRRRADLVFRATRVAVFVDGCFWHSCPTHGTSPKANGDWWAVKLSGNAARDRDTDRRLADEGWTVFRVWEHDEPQAAARRLAFLVKEKGRVTSTSQSRSSVPGPTHASEASASTSIPAGERAICAPRLRRGGDAVHQDDGPCPARSAPADRRDDRRRRVGDPTLGAGCSRQEGPSGCMHLDGAGVARQYSSHDSHGTRQSIHRGRQPPGS